MAPSKRPGRARTTHCSPFTSAASTKDGGATRGRRRPAAATGRPTSLIGPMPFRSPLLAAALGALVLAGCGAEDSALIPQADADRLTALVSEAGDASAAGDCERARRSVAEAERQLSGLPRKTDARLKANLNEW